MQSGTSICAAVKFQASFKPNDSNCDDWTWNRLSSIQRVSTGLVLSALAIIAFMFSIFSGLVGFQHQKICAHG
jgi:hypothetical protein